MKKVVHFEIPVDDMERAKKFYSIFEWHLQAWPMPDGSTYVGARSVEVDEKTYIPKEPGAINGGLVMRSAQINTPNICVNVPSIDEYVKKAENAGGKLVREKVRMEDSGYFAYVADSEGNLLALWEDIKK